MKRLLFISILALSFAAQGQVMLGIANSNFAGNMGMGLNPTSMLLMPYKWEFNLISGDIFLDNNYVRYPKAQMIGSTEGNNATLPHGGFLDNYNSTAKNAHTRVFLRLPSFIYRTNNDQAFGIHFAVRADISLRNITPNLAKYMYEGLQYPDLSGVPIQIDPFRIAGMTWMEVGLSYGRLFRKGNDHLIMAGTVNLIGAFHGLYFYNNHTDLTVDTTAKTMTINNMDAELAFDLPRNGNEAMKGRGKGVSMNIGFTYVSNPYRGVFKDARTIARKRYDYRIGASIIDAGMVYFDRNAHVYTINNSNTQLDSINTISPKGVTGFDQFIMDEFITGTSSIDNSFYLMTPIAGSVQFDYCFAPRWYANATVVQRANPPVPHVDLPNIVSITPRYETSFFEVALPYSLYDYYLNRIGLAVRYRFLVLGTDKLGTYISNNDVTGLDFYFGLKFSDWDFIRKGKRTRQAHCDAYN